MRHRLALGILLAWLCAAPGHAAEELAVTRPYLQGGTATRMGVAWLGSAPDGARVQAWADVPGARVRPDEGRLSADGRMHWLEGLSPGRRYHYSATVHGKRVGSGSFRTLPLDPKATVRFAVVGDTGSGAPMQFAVGRAITAWKPDFVLHTGDVMYENGEFEGYVPRFLAPYRDLVDGCVVYPSIGNHDHRTAQAGPYLRFFEVPRPSPDDSERWYSFQAGPAQFFALDTNVAFGEGSPQHRWLASALGHSRARWRFAFFHHPPYSGGAHGSSLYVRAAFGPLFERHDVQAVFAGHDHHYERSTPREDFIADGRPTTYFVTGGGGAWLRASRPAAHTAFQTSAHHFLGVTLQGGRATVEALDPGGASFDACQL